MAVVEHRGGRRRVVAQTAAELELLRHGRANGGELMLLEACFPVDGDSLVLPDTISEPGARRVCQALEHAAESHTQARRRRRQFRLVD